MESNIAFAFAAVVVALAAVILMCRFGPKKKPFIFDLVEAVGEPARRPISAGRRASRRKSEGGSPRISSRSSQRMVAHDFARGIESQSRPTSRVSYEISL